LVCIIGSGYTGFLGLYPILIAQKLTAKGITCIAVDYPGYGRSEIDRKESEVSIAAQTRAWHCAGCYARQVLGFSRVVGVSWAMGSPALLQASLIPPSYIGSDVGRPEKKSKTSDCVYDGLCMLNAILNADAVHNHVIKEINKERTDLQRQIILAGISKDINLPPDNLAAFRAKLAEASPGLYYPAFEFYPLDPQTLQVVIDQLYSHESYQVPQVRGSFWFELCGLNFDNVKLHNSTKALLVHGENNELHVPTNIDGFVATNKAQIANGKPHYLKGGKHNDFMNFNHKNFEEMTSTIAKFAKSLN
jgi:pimeloyl-ACP methyl ester carboxylesterase